MKWLMIAVALAAGACSGPTDSTPEDVVVFSADFEGGLPEWVYMGCTASIENDGDNYLLLTAEPDVRGPFCFSYCPEPRKADPPVALDISLTYRTAVLGGGTVYFRTDSFIGRYYKPSPEWREVNFRATKTAWPTTYDMGVVDFDKYRPGMAFAVDDIKVVAVY